MEAEFGHSPESRHKRAVWLRFESHYHVVDAEAGLKPYFAGKLRERRKQDDLAIHMSFERLGVQERLEKAETRIEA